MKFLQSLIESGYPEAQIPTVPVADLGTVRVYDLEIDEPKEHDYDNYGSKIYRVDFNFVIDLVENEEMTGKWTVVVDFLYYMDDRSFDYERGSQRGGHTDKSMVIEFKDIVESGFRSTEENYQFLKIDPKTLHSVQATLKSLDGWVEKQFQKDDAYSRYSVLGRLYSYL